MESSQAATALPQDSHRAQQPAAAQAGGAAVAAATWLLACPGPESGEVAVWDMRAGAAHQVGMARVLWHCRLCMLPIPTSLPSSSVKGCSGPHQLTAGTWVRAHLFVLALRVQAGLLPPPQPPTRPAQDPNPSLPAAHGMAMAVHLLAGGSTSGSSSGGGVQVLVGYESGGVALWDLRAPGRPVSLAERVHTEPVMALSCSPDGRQAVSGSADSTVGVLELRAANGAGSGGQHQAAGAPADGSGHAAHETATAEDAGGTRSGAGSAGSSGQAPGLRVCAQLPLTKPGVGDVCFRPDGRVFAVGGWDGKVRGWL
jgi:hypothetical protein